MDSDFENPFLNRDEKKTLDDLKEQYLKAELTSGFLRSDDPKKLAAALGVTVKDYEKMSPDAIQELSSSARRSAMVSRADALGKAQIQQGETMDRSSIRGALEAKEVPDAVNIADVISKNNMGNNPVDWTNAVSAKVMQARDDVANNRVQQVGKTALDALTMAIAADKATFDTQQAAEKERSVEATGTEPRREPKQFNPAEGPRAKFVMDAFFNPQDGFMPDYGKTADLQNAGLLPMPGTPSEQPLTSKAALEQAQNAGQVTPSGQEPGGVVMKGDQGGPLAGGMHVQNPALQQGHEYDQAPPLSFSQGPQGIMQQGVTAPAPAVQQIAAPAPPNVPTQGFEQTPPSPESKYFAPVMGFLDKGHQLVNRAMDFMGNEMQNVPAYQAMQAAGAATAANPFEAFADPGARAQSRAAMQNFVPPPATPTPAAPTPTPGIAAAQPSAGAGQQNPAIAARAQQAKAAGPMAAAQAAQELRRYGIDPSIYGL